MNNVGKVFEIRTPLGLAYVQVTHRNPHVGVLARVLPGHFAERPGDFASLVAGPTRFAVLYDPVSAARQGFASEVGRFEVPEHARAFPLMLWPVPKRAGLEWALWDGEQVVDQVTSLTLEQESLPHRALVNHPLLIEWVGSHWAWRDETALELADDARAQAERRARGETDPPPSLLGRLTRGLRRQGDR